VSREGSDDEASRSQQRWDHRVPSSFAHAISMAIRQDHCNYCDDVRYGRQEADVKRIGDADLLK
jgi:hypothetical protein